MENKLSDINRFFKSHNHAAIALSGGVDSAVLLYLAKVSGTDIKAYFVKSAFQPQFELEHARRLCEDMKVPLEIIYTDVLSDKNIARNSNKRCYYCKKKIFQSVIARAKSDGRNVILDGTNATDDIADRPGYAALGELGVLSPLRLCKMTKKDIRRIAKENHIFLWDKPSYACLATRIPTGTPVTGELLEKTEAAENELMKLGFCDFRIRYSNGGAVLQLAEHDFPKLLDNRKAAASVLKKYYNSAMLDLDPRHSEG